MSVAGGKQTGSLKFNNWKRNAGRWDIKVAMYNVIWERTAEENTGSAIT